MIVNKNIYYLLFIVLIVTFSQLSAQDPTQKIDKKYLETEKFLYDYYTIDLQITDVIVKIDKEIVAVSGTPDFRDRDKAIGQIVLAVSGAGTAAPWTRDICFTIQIKGMPLGFFEVPTRKAMLASEGKMSPEAFISSFIATQLPLPFDFPKDLLLPVLRSAELWKGKPVIECNGNSIGELLNINIESFLPEFLQAAYVKADPSDGSQTCIAAVVDLEDHEEAKDLYALNGTDSLNKKIFRIGSIIYIIKGSEVIVNKGIASLKPKPKSVISGNVNADEKNFPGKKFIVIGAGFLILLIIVITVFIISGKYSGKRP